MAPGKRKTKAKPKDDDDSNYLEETKLDDLDPDLPSYHDTSEQEEEEEKQPESKARQTSSQFLKTRKKPPPAAKRSEEDSDDMEIEEESQDNPDNMNEAVNEKTIMRLMEQALTDPEMNSTWKKAIDYQVKRRIEEIQQKFASGGNPDDDRSSGDDEDDDNPPEDSSRRGRYNRRSSHPKITIKGFNSGRILSPEQLAFRNSLMDFGINQESADEIMRGGMSNIHWARYQPVIEVKPRATDWNKSPDNLELQQFRIKMMQSSEKSQEKATPPELKDLSKFREWEEGFCQNLRYRFNSEGFPILYVIRPQEKETVCDESQNGTNTELISGHARNAFISLMQHAYTDTNITMRNWTTFHGTIMRFEKNHNEQSKDYRDNFNECLILFTNRLGLKKLANGKNKRSSRSVYSFGTTGNKKQKTTGSFTGKLENKPYPTSVYATMSKAQPSKKKRALKAAETKKAKEAEKAGAGDSFGSKSKKI
eukprot:jgi/Psemu1/57493/gm1.57493_g